MKNELKTHYTQDRFKFIRGFQEPKSISPTETLLSKIMLGTLGCVPAYDRYFVEGMKEMKIEQTGFTDASLSELFNFIDSNQNELYQVQKLIFNKIQKHYPLMKILDMYFWQIGYEKIKIKN